MRARANRGPAAASALAVRLRLGADSRRAGDGQERFENAVRPAGPRHWLLAWACVWTLALTGWAAKGAVLEVTSGLASYQVLQRDATGHADVELAGRVTAEGADSIEARILRRRLVVEGFDWNQVGSASGDRWTAKIKALPVGGPYKVELRALGENRETLASAAVQSVLVGDLWVLSGQSNMVGNGRLEDLEPPHELVHNFNPRDEWQVAEEPLHSLAESIDEVHWKHASHLLSLWARPGQQPDGPLVGEDAARFRRNRQHGAGLALTFSKDMVRRTGIPIGLVPCAHGGTSIGPGSADWPGWDPALKQQGRKSLYGAMIERFLAVGGRVKGVLWYQGEADMREERAAEYAERFSGLIEAIRADFGQPDLPFYYAQIGRYVTENRMRWNKIQEVQRLAEQVIPNVGMVASVDLGLDDIIHISGEGLKTAGHRFANLACHDLFPEVEACRDLKRGPRPGRAYVQVNRGRLDPWGGDRRTLYVEFSDVNGRLRSAGRLSGFSIRDADETEILAIFRAFVDPRSPNRVVLELGRGIPNEPLPPGAKLWYGWGADPYCNLVDDANMAAPVFGPMDIEGVPSGN